VTLLFVPALVVSTLYAWAFVDHARAVVSFPFQVDYGEMPELNRAVLLAAGRPVYVDWSRPPYQMANYTPLYALAVAPAVALGGPSFFPGRLLSLLSTVLTAGCIALTAARLGGASAGGRRGAPLAGALAGLLYLAGYPVWAWGALQRVDAFAVALEWVAVALFAAAVARAGPAVPGPGEAVAPAGDDSVVRAAWLTLPLFLCAVYARQTVVAGAVAVYGTLLLRRPRLGLALTAAFGAAGLTLLGGLQSLTGGQFWRHIVDGNLNDWDWERVDFYWQPFWATMHWVFPLAALGLLLGTVAATRRARGPGGGPGGSERARRAALLPALYLLAAAATALTIGKIGANVNYLLQLWAALALLAGLAAGRAAALPGPGGAALGGAVAAWLLIGLQQAYHVPYEVAPAAGGAPETVRPTGAAAQLLAAARWPRLPLWRLDPWGAGPAVLQQRARDRYPPHPSAAEAVAAGEASAAVAATSGDVLGEEMSFSVTTGRRLYLQPFEFSQLAAQGAWDQEPLLAEVRRGAFAVVVLRFRLGDDPLWRRERVNDALIAVLQEAYTLDAVYGDYYLYRPKAAAVW
jgi:hypothetical protein